MPPRVDPIGWGSRCWGIEFEFTRTCSKEGLVEAVRYALPDINDTGGLRVADWEHTHNNNREWVVKRDGSCGWEICTPKSKTVADMDRVCKVLDACRLVGGCVGPNTGVHIHFECRDMDASIMGRVVAYWVKSEGMLFWALPRKRRANRYCMHLSRAAEIKSRASYGPEDLVRMTGSSRYRALNLKPWLSDCGRIEVRVIEGLIDGEEVRNWTSYFLYWIGLAAASDFPRDLRWWGLDDFMNWMGWARRPDGPLGDLRDWWLRRFIRFASVRADKGGYRARAKWYLSQGKASE